MSRRRCWRQKIVNRIKRRMEKGELPVGPELVELVADWARVLDHTEETPDKTRILSWPAWVARQLLMNRTTQFVEYTRRNPGRNGRKALAGIQLAYIGEPEASGMYAWVLNCRWGWLQRELDKPGLRFNNRHPRSKSDGEVRGREGESGGLSPPGHPPMAVVVKQFGRCGGTRSWNDRGQRTDSDVKTEVQDMVWGNNEDSVEEKGGMENEF